MDEYTKKSEVLALVKRAIASGWSIDQLYEEMQKLPAADAVPLRHGRWIDKGSLSCRCSECGCKSTKESPYCHICGAIMDGEDER